MQHEISITPLNSIAEIFLNDDLAEIIYAAIVKQKINLKNDDIIVVTQKIVSKAEGEIVDLRTITPSFFAEKIAKEHNKDPRYIEVVLSQTKRIVRMDHGVLICETHHGIICANAGVDASNIHNRQTVSLLPKNPDAAAKLLQEKMQNLSKKTLAIIISDTWGRPWREGQVNMAIGCAGMEPLIDYRGEKDMFGNLLSASVIASADELAAAAELVMGKSEGIPVAIIRGYTYKRSTKNASILLRKPETDMFR